MADLVLNLRTSLRKSWRFRDMTEPVFVYRFLFEGACSPHLQGSLVPPDEALVPIKPSIPPHSYL